MDIQSVVVDLGFSKGGFQCALDWSLYLAQRTDKAREARPLEACGGGGGHAPPPPPKKIFDFRPSEIVSGAVLR